MNISHGCSRSCFNALLLKKLLSNNQGLSIRTSSWFTMKYQRYVINNKKDLLIVERWQNKRIVNIKCWQTTRSTTTTRKMDPTIASTTKIGRTKKKSNEQIEHKSDAGAKPCYQLATNKLQTNVLLLCILKGSKSIVREQYKSS